LMICPEAIGPDPKFLITRPQAAIAHEAAFPRTPPGPVGDGQACSPSRARPSGVPPVPPMGRTAVGVLPLLSSATGAALGWKKNVEWLQPPNQRGVSTDIREWRPWYEVDRAAVAGLRAHLPAGEADGIEVDRHDVRPGHGPVKIQFDHRNWEVQVDPVTLEVLNVSRRHSDWIE